MSRSSSHRDSTLWATICRRRRPTAAATGAAAIAAATATANTRTRTATWCYLSIRQWYNADCPSKARNLCLLFASISVRHSNNVPDADTCNSIGSLVHTNESSKRSYPQLNTVTNTYSLSGRNVPKNARASIYADRLCHSNKRDRN